MTCRILPSEVLMFVLVCWTYRVGDVTKQRMVKARVRISVYPEALLWVKQVSV